MRDLQHIVCVDAKGGYSKDGKIPWYHPEDLAHFKEKTKDSIVIMGRKTYRSILQNLKPGAKFLPGRECYVISQSEDFQPVYAKKIKTWRQTIDEISEDDSRQVFIVGGNQLWTETMPFTNQIHITVLNIDYNCDKFYPMEYIHKDFSQFRIDKQNETLSYVTYIRIKDDSQSNEYQEN